MTPLAGIRVVEIAGIGPAPMAGMLLADMGADVVRIDRPEPEQNGVPVDDRFDLFGRGKRAVALDLKQPADRDAALALVAKADLLIEGLRPGAMERLGLGPDECMSRNPALVYGRVTGWGQTGPLALTAGHDINFIARTGALDAIGEQGRGPVVPLNLIGDFGGGALYLVTGVLSGLLAARTTGRGTVVDAAMVDGVASLMTMLLSHQAAGIWNRPRGENLLDGGAPFYAVYATGDGRHVAVGALEEKFYRLLLRLLELPETFADSQHDLATWPAQRAALAARFAERSAGEWTALFAGSDACVSPVLTLEQAATDPHLAARSTLVTLGGVPQPAPAPRFGGVAPVPNGPVRRIPADRMATIW